MKKLYTVVNLEVTRSGVLMCLVEHYTETEHVDPAKEHARRAILKMKEAGIDMPALESLTDVFGEISSVMAQKEEERHPGHMESAKVMLTDEEYYGLGRPGVGELVELTVVLGKAPADPAGAKAK